MPKKRIIIEMSQEEIQKVSNGIEVHCKIDGHYIILRIKEGAYEYPR